MSRTIDERVVEMRFDNANFERNVSTSMSTLDKLKQSLNFSGVSGSLDAVSQKFSVLETIAVGALLRIGSQGVDVLAGKIKELTLDQVTAGWEKYADKTQAVQTIMAATAKEFSDTGVQMEYVSGQMERLNWFTDETSYSFLDMVNNIGKFTSNNISLEQSVTAMQGISTWAAISGANVNEAGRAMYNLSQAIAVGAVKLMDWKSIENANMATAEFKQTAIDTAVALGKLVDKGDGLYETMDGNAVSVQNFNSALSDCWFTSEVLLKTLDQYGGFSVTLGEIADQTGLTATQLLDYLDQYREGSLDLDQVLKELKEDNEDLDLTVDDLKESFDALADPMNELGERAFRAAQEAKTFKEVLDSVKDAVSTGWMNTFELIFGNYEEAKKLWTQLANELYDVFAEGGNLRNEMLEAWRKLGGRNDLIDAFWNIFHAITAVIDIIKSTAGEALAPFLSDVESGAEWLANLTSRLKEFSEKLTLVDEKTGEFNETGQKIKQVFEGVFAVIGLIKDVAAALIKPISAVFEGMGSSVLDLAADTGSLLVRFREMVQESGVLEQITERLSGVFRSLGEFIRNTVDIIRQVGYAIYSLVDGLGFAEGNIASIVRGIFDSISNVVKFFFDSLSSLTGKDFSGLRDKIVGFIERIRDGVANAIGPLSNVFEKVRDVLSRAFQAIKKVFSGFGKIDTGGISDLSQRTESAFKPLTAFFEGIKKIFSAVVEVLKKLQPLFSKVFEVIGSILGKIGDAISSIVKNADFSKLSSLLEGLVTTGIGIKLMQFIESLRKGSDSLRKNLKDTFEAIKDCIEGLSECIESYKRSTDASTLLKIAAAIGILATAMLVLSSIDSEKLRSSIFALTALFGELIGSMALMSKIEDLKSVRKVGKTLIELAAAVLVLAAALKMIASLDADQLSIGLTGVTALLAELIIAAKLLGDDKQSGKMMKGATNAIAFAAAILVLSVALKSLAKLNDDELARGIVGISALLILLVGAAKIIGNDKDSGRMMKGAANALIFSAAILVLVGALKSIAKLSWEDLAKGLVGLTVVLGEMVIAAKILSGEGSFAVNGRSITGSSGSTMMKGATNALIFSAAILLLASAVKSLSKLSWEELAKGLVGLTVVMAEMVVAAKLMEGSGSGSASMVVAAAAILVLAGAFKVISSISWEGIAKGLVAIGAAFVIIGVAGLLLSPIIPAIYALAGAMALMGVAAVLFGAGLLAVSAALSAFAGSAEIIVNAIIHILTRLVTAIPDILGALANSLNAALDSLIEILFTLATAALEAMSEIIPTAVDVILNLILSVLQSLAANIAPIIEALLDIVVGIINGLTAGIPKIINATVELLSSVFEALGSALGGLSIESISNAIACAALLDVLMVELAAMAALAVVALAPLPVVGLLLSDFVDAAQPFLNGIQNVDPQAVESAKLLAETILILTANELLDTLTHWLTGGVDYEEFGKQVVKLGETMVKYSDTVAGYDFDDAVASAAALKSLIETFNQIEDYGIFDRFSQGNKLKDFGAGLHDIGIYFSQYAKAVASENISYDKVGEATTALKNLIDTLSSIKDTKILDMGSQGDKLIDFAEGLAEFGPKFVDFAKSVEGQSFGNVTVSATALQHLVDTLNQIDHGKISKIWLVDIADGLSAFAPGYISYVEQTTGVHFGNVTVSATALKSLMDALNQIDPAGAFDMMTQGGKLKDFGQGLAEFGPNYVAYAQSVEGQSFGNITVSATALKSLVDVFNLIDPAGAFDLMTQGAKLKDFGEGLAEFGPKFVAYAQSVEGQSFGNITISATALKALLDAFSNIETTKWGDLMSQSSKLKDFGEGLAAFGPSFVAYAQSVEGQSFGNITVSATALKNLVDVFNMIDPAGAFDLMTQGSKLKDFGEGLSEFGPEFVSYAQSVAGQSFGNVTVSATALKGLLDALNGIETTKFGDLMSQGSKLKDFGTGLKEFGPGFVAYAKSVSEVNSFDKVTESARSLKSLIITLGGIKDTGFFDNMTQGGKLKDFGDGLKELGPGLASYATQVQGVNDFDKVTASAQAIAALVSLGGDLQLSNVDNWAELTELANALNSFAEPFLQFAEKFSTDAVNVEQVKTVIDALVIVANGIAGLSEEYIERSSGLVLFASRLMTAAPYLKNFASTLSAVDGDQLSSSIDAINNLVQMCQGIVDIDGDSISAFGDALQNLGTIGIEGFITAFTDGKVKTDEAMRNMLQGMLDEISKKESRFKASARTLMNQFVNGLREKREAPKQELVNAISNMITYVRNEYYDDFYALGKYFVEGFAAGITENVDTARDAGATMAQSAVDAARSTLDENSPSRVMYKVGQFGVAGFVRAFFDNAGLAYDAGHMVADASVRGINQAIQNAARLIEFGEDSQPMIRPVLDLSNVRSGMSTLNSIISMDKALSVGMSISGGGYSEDSRGPAPAAGGTINFTQNNYSPKALSRLEIYRQTRNQLSMMKGLVRAR